MNIEQILTIIEIIVLFLAIVGVVLLFLLIRRINKIANKLAEEMDETSQMARKLIIEMEERSLEF